MLRFNVDSFAELGVCLKFGVSKEIFYADALKMLQKALGGSALSKIRAYEAYEDFESGRMMVEGLLRSRCLSTSKTDKTLKKSKRNHFSQKFVIIAGEGFLVK